MDPSPVGSSRRGRRAGAALFLLACPAALGALGPGCDVTAENIEQWKGTEKGPGKLRDALKSSSLSPELRGQALAALVEIGSLGEVAEDLKEIPEAQRQGVVHAATPLLLAMARGKGPGAEPGSTTRLERNGKDALFLVRDGAGAADRDAIDKALIEWTTADLEGRMTAGVASTEKILSAIGAAAGGRLVAVIADPATSDLNRTSAARLLGKLGDREGREQGGAALVERARKEKKVSGETLTQMGLVGGDHVVAYLTALAADAGKGAEQRAQALMALAQLPDPAQLGPAMRLAADPKAPAAVRDAAFEVLGKLGPAAVPGLARLLDDKNDKIRWETVETMLLAGQAPAIPAVLDGLPPGRSYPKEDLEDFLVKPLARLGTPALPALRDGLKSASWVARLGAAMAIARLGTRQDATAVDALAADATRLKGWPGSATLGAEARALAATLRSKP